MRPATETMVKAFGLVDRKRRRLLVVKRAKSHIFAALAHQFDFGADNFGHRNPRAQFVKKFLKVGFHSLFSST